MAQITEDYCSFETAKLLKEKRFDDIPVYTYYLSYGGFYMTPMAVTNKDLHAHGHIAAPTLQMATKWLREVHNKSIEVRSQGLKATSIGWVVGIYNLRTQDEEYHHPYTFPTYEEACEEAIKYCLENLI